jgi:predicted DNA-binding transcriptional regulator AlpA
MTAKRFLTGPQVDERYGIVPATRWRWEHDPELGFPPPLKLQPHKGGRKRYALDELEAWERRQAAASSKQSVARDLPRRVLEQVGAATDLRASSDVLARHGSAMGERQLGEAEDVLNEKFSA